MKAYLFTCVYLFTSQLKTRKHYAFSLKKTTKKQFSLLKRKNNSSRVNSFFRLWGEGQTKLPS